MTKKKKSELIVSEPKMNCYVAAERSLVLPQNCPNCDANPTFGIDEEMGKVYIYCTNCWMRGPASTSFATAIDLWNTLMVKDGTR